MTISYKVALGLALAVLAVSLWVRIDGVTQETASAILVSDTWPAANRPAFRAPPAIDTALPPDAADPASTETIPTNPNPATPTTQAVLADTPNTSVATPSSPTAVASPAADPVARDVAPDANASTLSNDPFSPATPQPEPPALVIGRIPQVTASAALDRSSTLEVSVDAADQPGAQPNDAPADPQPTRASREDAAAPSANASADAPRFRPYTVQPGDSLATIAQRIYGNQKHWQDIAQANPTLDPVKLKPGQTLRLPLLANVPLLSNPPAASNPTSPPPAGPVMHTVQNGDSLSTIAARYYGDSTLWHRIYQANREQIGGNPNALQAGSSLTIPPRP